MAKLIRLIAAVAAISLAAPAWSQDTAKNAPVRVVTKTLVASEAQKECLSLNCLVWTNTGKHSVTLRYEFQRGSQ